MSQIKQTTTILSGTINLNLVTGLKQQYLQFNAAVKLYAVQDTVAGSILSVTMTLGNIVIGEDLIPNTPGANLGPRLNEDIIGGSVGVRNDLLQIRVRETTGGVGADGILRWLVDITDMP